MKINTTEFLKQQKLYFGVPMYGGMCNVETVKGLMDISAIFTKLSINYYHEFMSNESLITRARNNIVANFLSTDATHLMFIDADIGFTGHDILKLLCDNQDVVGGLYPKKSLPTSYVVNNLSRPLTVEDNPNLVEVSNIGTGFMMIKRHVLERMIEHYSDLKINDNIKYLGENVKFLYALFDTSVDENKNYLSEDWTFCQRWRGMGGKIFADKSIKLDHTGYYKFEGDPTKIVL